ncbi:putative jacalin-like lectin domain-containing protein [Tanacetum coccineum]|uniref:Jacalin-like lectin domain-containing protein n=1 Tax=Tanacetum coccineum TaxID=301880 RepID=A0ABQ5ABQ8_9ASTR
MLASYKHDNLVSHVGFYDEHNEKIVVYEHEVRGSLNKYLATTNLTWVQRLQICLRYVLVLLVDLIIFIMVQQIKIKRGGERRGVKEKQQGSANDTAHVTVVMPSAEDGDVLSSSVGHTVEKVMESGNIKGHGADVAVSLESIRAISEWFINTAYGFLLGKRVAYPIVANYVRNTWGKYGLVKSMLNSSTRLFFFQFSSMDGLDSMLENDVGNVPVWVKLHGVPVKAFSEDGLSAITTKLGTPFMLDSYTSDMCMQSWGRSSYARAMTELRADVELKDTIVDEFPKNIGSGVAKNLKNPNQAPRGVPVGPTVDFKPAKQVYTVSKKNNANTSGNKKKDAESRKEVSNPNPFDVLNSVENDVDLGTNGGTSNLASKEANSNGSSFWNVRSSSIISGDHDSEDKVEPVDNEMTSFLTSKKINFDVDEEIIGISGTVGVTTGRHQGFTPGDVARECRPGRNLIRAFPFHLSRGKAILATSRPGNPGFVPGDSGKCCSKHFKIPLRDINLAANNFPKFHRLNSNIMTEFQKLANNPLKIRLEDIKLATNNFAEDNSIGKGGFGRVYKGQLKSTSGEPDTDVAVKMLDVIYGQGEHEFGTEIHLLNSYKHNNIVSLVGFCDEEGKKALVYKYEVHGSLDRHLANTADLTWEQRLRICLGAAHGLEYLHGSEEAGGHRVIHRDIKSSNILLDANWEAKISDFGLAKLGLTGQEISVMYTNQAGTAGYVDPQYHKTGMLTKESDVFSFGVVMFEVLSGRPGFVDCRDERSFLYTWAKTCYEAGELDKLIIPNLLKQMNSLSLEKFSSIAFECLNDDRKKRPKMTYIVQELKAALELQVGKVEQTELWGSSKGGDPWSYLFINNRKLRKIIIRHGEYCIHSITFIVEDINGSLYSSKRYGGDGPISYEVSEIILNVDEEVIGISGTVATWDPLDKVISSLCFKTNKKNYEVGEPKHIISEFSRSWDVGSLVGFHGRCGFYLDGFGCCLKNWNASI